LISFSRSPATTRPTSMPLRRRGYEARFGRSPTYTEVVEQLALTPTERQTLLRRLFEQALREIGIEPRCSLEIGGIDGQTSCQP
jgi:hypothetical protein